MSRRSSADFLATHSITSHKDMTVGRPSDYILIPDYNLIPRLSDYNLIPRLSDYNLIPRLSDYILPTCTTSMFVFWRVGAWE